MAVCNMDCFKGGLPTKEETARGRAAWPTFEAAREAERKFLHRFNFTPAEMKRMKAAASRDGAVYEVVKRKPARPKKQLTEAEIQAKKEQKKVYNHNYWLRKKEERKCSS